MKPMIAKSAKAMIISCQGPNIPLAVQNALIIFSVFSIINFSKRQYHSRNKQKV